MRGEGYPFESGRASSPPLRSPRPKGGRGPLIPGGRGASRPTRLATRPAQPSPPLAGTSRHEDPGPPDSNGYPLARIAGASGHRFPTSQTPAAERLQASAEAARVPSSDRRNRSKPSSERRPDPSVAHCCITPIAAATPWLLLEHGRGSATISALTRWRARRAASRSGPRAVSRGAPGLPRLRIACSPTNPKPSVG